MYLIKLGFGNACFVAPHCEKRFFLLFPSEGRSFLSHCEPAEFLRHKNAQEAVQMTNFKTINH